MPRATPLPPAERRAAIVAATIPLLKSDGIDVSTKRIAEAAGVAEGTLFRAFPNKDALINATIGHVMDPHRFCDRIRAIDPTQPLEIRLEETITLLSQRMDEMMSFFHAIGSAMEKLRRNADPQEMRKRRTEENQLVHAAIADLIGPDHDQLRVGADEAALLLGAMTFSICHPMTEEVNYSSAEIVQILLHGIGQPTAEPSKTKKKRSSTPSSTKDPSSTKGQ